MTRTPEFDDALRRYQQAERQYGDMHPTTLYLWQFVMDTAPPEYMKAAEDLMTEMNMMPEARYTDDGEPVVRLEDMAVKCGMSPEEAQQSIEEFIAMRKAAGREGGIYTNIRTHRRQ